MCKASYSRKKRGDEMVTARQFEVNEWKAITEKEGKDHGKGKLIMVRVCLMVNKSRSSKKLLHQN